MSTGPDPRNEAEKRLRAGLAREARETRETLERVKYAGYGCLVLIAIGIAIAFLL
jgi:hypothetical protein